MPDHRTRVVWDEELTGYDFGPGHPMSPVRLALTIELARALGVPLVSVACAVPMDPEPGVPLPFLGWAHDTTAEGLRRNAGGERVADLLMIPQTRVIRRWAQTWGLGDLRRLQDCLSPDLALRPQQRCRAGPALQRLLDRGPFGKGTACRPTGIASRR